MTNSMHVMTFPSTQLLAGGGVEQHYGAIVAWEEGEDFSIRREEARGVYASRSEAVKPSACFAFVNGAAASLLAPTPDGHELAVRRKIRRRVGLRKFFAVTAYRAAGRRVPEASAAPATSQQLFAIRREGD